MGFPLHFLKGTSAPSCPLIPTGKESLQKVLSENLTKVFPPLMESVILFSVFCDNCPLCPCLLLIQCRAEKELCSQAAVWKEGQICHIC